MPEPFKYIYLVQARTLRCRTLDVRLVGFADNVRMFPNVICKRSRSNDALRLRQLYIFSKKAVFAVKYAVYINLITAKYAAYTNLITAKYAAYTNLITAKLT